MRAARSSLINEAEQRQDDEVFTSGEWMKKKYKSLSIVAVFLSISSFVVIMLRWRGVWESLYIFPARVAVGLLKSSQFIGLSAAVEKSRVVNLLSALRNLQILLS